MRHVRLIGTATACLAVAYLALLAARAARSGLSWREMDFDHDGMTSISEFFEAADVGARPVHQNGRACTEYFLLKDGTAVKVICPAGVTSR